MAHLFPLFLTAVIATLSANAAGGTDSNRSGVVPAPETPIDMLRRALRQTPLDRDAIVNALQRDPSLVQRPFIGSVTLLSYLCQRSGRHSLDLVRLVCEQYGARVDVAAAAGALHPLSAAVLAQDLALVRYLCRQGPDPASAGDALALAAARSNPGVFRALLQYHTGPLGRDDRAVLDPAFLAAAGQARLASMRALYEAGASLDARDRCGSTAAHLIVRHGLNRFYAPLAWLTGLRPGLLGVADAARRTALDLLRDNPTCAPPFLAYMERVAAANGNRPLPPSPSPSGARAMCDALARPVLDPNEIRAVLAADPTTAYANLDGDGRHSALIILILQHPYAIGIAQILIENGADLDIDDAGQSSLLAAVDADAALMVGYLLGHWQIDLDQVVEALVATVRDDRRDTFPVVLEHVARTVPTLMDRAGADGRTPFQEAAARGDYHRLRSLYGSGRVDAHQCDPDGNTVAHLAAASTAAYVVDVLLWMHMTLDGGLLFVRNRDGRSALDVVGDRDDLGREALALLMDMMKELNRSVSIGG